ncbi:FtsW/RodA/SpoVE family cell cycle protein [Thermoflexus sp.]|uniref:FtsW/RodA/SpoVE family cell cycle protein n=1 Tax=Thermoflexus sp. TaxID=1969742 RepID=UPI0025F02681|nr:FtsW/RodA/SpoVE family cell cycle protein [Thermoflexus sp.]MDW8179374.1 FtsW/RodA/SpoVE family cell cycle protein [Anaerolineae bacterium]MCS6963187.1 FtsW/RodA/SpoVE family cell cycle protein [Thermoflexus sp.]MCS7349927.1 FtsW/RodA/SpoVE family cell cycle protein [Thermoflexus sp.]MCX7689675.1 FtsW/RodA/SpoVE family cell cycle protein [Thermoflexus sp.]MDW8184469.1 FtsW/RodA/SpoVE family cell cycle protein [Anaerolineae bacterium]
MTTVRKQWYGSSIPRDGPLTLPGLTSLELGLLVLLVTLVLAGLLLVYSATYYLARQIFDDPFYFVRRQAGAALAGTLALLGVWRMDYRRLQRFSIPLMLLGVASLIAVLFVGEERLGARRAFSGGSFQPSEFVKPIIILYLATWLPTKGERLREFGRGFLPFLMVLSVVVIPIFLQPDLGTGMLIGMVAAWMFVASGATPIQVLLGLALGAGVFGVLVQVHPHAMARLLDYLEALRGPEGAQGHLSAVWQAIRSGGLFGRGPGAILYTLSGRVPLPHSDSAFAVVGEAFGFVGVMGLISLLSLWVFLGFRVARQACDAFGGLLALGVTLWIAWQGLINLGGLTGVIPFSGIPFPFISYGGSALLSELIGAGMLLSVARRRGDEDLDRRGRDRRAHLSGAGRRGGAPGR